MQSAVLRIRGLLEENGIKAEVSGRPKHIYSIWKKMQRKHLRFDQLFDVRAVRIIVDTVERCYQVLSIVHENFPVISKEYDDYIAKPKPNGYQSLHTVVTDKAGRPLEIQIRTRAMHEFAELGVAAHWRYKEAGQLQRRHERPRSSASPGCASYLPGAATCRATDSLKARPCWTTTSMRLRLRAELLNCPGAQRPSTSPMPCIRSWATARRAPRSTASWCRSTPSWKPARPLRSSPQRWVSPRATGFPPKKALPQVPAPATRFASGSMRSRPRSSPHRGARRSTRSLRDSARRPSSSRIWPSDSGMKALTSSVLPYGKEEITQTALATAVQPPKSAVPEPDEIQIRQSRNTGKSDVLVVGVDSLLTQLARCCHPVPPDEIVGYVTRGRGVTIHRADCPNIRNMSEQDHGRLIEVSWGRGGDGVFPAEVFVVAADRPGLIRDISEIFMKAKQNLVGMNSQKVKSDVHMRFTVEIPTAASLTSSLTAIRELKGVLSARRC